MPQLAFRLLLVPLWLLQSGLKLVRAAGFKASVVAFLGQRGALAPQDADHLLQL
ncbi:MULTISPECIES: hypothetical protein [unclassified Streptomyces]|uniref:hypothetical protein n=1 Tax=Streptomyces sp. NPDC127129 TaxID=3345373 RepID=UPI003642860C